MKISYNWLKRYLDFQKTPTEVSETITRLGLEVESVTSLGVAENPLLVVGEILSREKHPNADKLSVCKVDVGSGTPLQIVCGAPNCDAGNRVPVALVGCKLTGKNKEGVEESFEIKAAKLRGVESQGMLCAPDEIGMGSDHAGLLILQDKPALGKKVHELFAGDVVFEVAVLPNRPDALSHFGLARDLAAAWSLTLKKPSAPKIAESGAPSFKGIFIENFEDSAHYRGAIIRGVKVGPSPAWLQELLKSVGLRSISNIVDITNYFCLGFGQPMHAFDLSKIEGGELRVRRAKEGEKLKALDGKEYNLDASILTISDANKPLAIAGVMGGEASSVTNATTDILLETAVFNSTLIRKTSRKLQLSSDSSYRYERGIDPLGLEPAAELAVQMILEIAGGKLEGGALIAGKANCEPKIISVSREFLIKKLGFEVSNAEIEKALTGFGFGLKKLPEGAWEVSVPSYRLDVFRPVDLIEEVLRFFGVDKIPSSVPLLPANESRDDALYTVTRKLSQRLVALGYNECLHYTLRSKEELSLDAAVPELHAIANPLSVEMSSLRTNLIRGLVQALELNRSRGNLLEPLFETGRVFRSRDKELYEVYSIAFVKVVSPAVETWRKDQADGFFEVKSVVENLLRQAGINTDEAKWQPIDRDSFWQIGHSGYWEIGKNEKTRSSGMAVAGFINNDVLKYSGFNGAVLAGEITFSLDAFTSIAPIKRYTSFSSFPGTRRDVALIVKEETSAGEVENTLKKIVNDSLAGKFNLENISIFDLYRGAGVPEAHKSLAFALNFRAADRTLTDDEVAPVFGAILEKLKAAGYQIRG